jgi:hypothetical protein
MSSRKVGRPRIDGRNRITLTAYVVEEAYREILNSADSKDISISREASLALEKIYCGGNNGKIKKKK